MLDNQMRERLDGAFQNVSFNSSDGATYASIFTPANGVTADRAMRIAAVFACVRIIAGAIASLPVHVYKRTDDGGRERPNPEHNYWWLLNEQPHAIWTSALAWEYAITSMVFAGDAYFYIIRNRLANEITALKPMPACDTIVERRGERLVYFFNDNGARIGADQSDVLHFPGFGFNGLHGMSLISYAASNAASGAASADDHSAKFFENGTLSKHVLTAPGKLGMEARDSLRTEWQDRYAGNKNAYRPIVLDSGLTIKELTMSATDSQLLESRQYQVVDIARAFGVPPVMIGSTDGTSNFGTGVKELSRAFVNFTLQRWLGPIAQELNRKLWPTRERYFVEHDTDAYIQSDPSERATIDRGALGGAQGAGYMSVNEVRKNRKLAPIPGGDTLYMPPTDKAKTNELA